MNSNHIQITHLKGKMLLNFRKEIIFGSKFAKMAKPINKLSVEGVKLKLKVEKSKY